MGKSWLVCVFLGTLAWGQAQPAAPAAPAPAQASPAPKEAAPAAEVPMSAAVITIKGVSCPEFMKPGAAPTAAAGKTATATGKTAAAAKKPMECQITRAEFEKLTKVVQQGPNALTAQQKRAFAGQLPQAIAMSEAAKKKGLDKTQDFQETMKFVKIRVLTTELQHSVQEEADKVPPQQIEKYYKENPEAFEQFSLDRLFIPRYKQLSAEEKEQAKGKETEKLTEDEQKAKEAADKAKQEKGEKELNELAESLRQRAVAGEDFTKLQKEAFEAAGTKVENPTVNLPKVRRTGLPPAHVAVFDLKTGDVSQVISDNGGHYIYKVVSKEVLPLDDKMTGEIHTKLKSERLKEMMDKYTNSFQATTNDAYFGPATPPGPQQPGQRMRPRPGAPVLPQAQPQGAAPQAPPPATNAPAQTPAPTAPPSKPN
jgi:PPIC-type PPIASE domain